MIQTINRISLALHVVSIHIQEKETFHVINCVVVYAWWTAKAKEASYVSSSPRLQYPVARCPVAMWMTWVGVMVCPNMQGQIKNFALANRSYTASHSSSYIMIQKQNLLTNFINGKTSWRLWHNSLDWLGSIFLTWYPFRNNPSHPSESILPRGQIGVPLL